MLSIFQSRKQNFERQFYQWLNKSLSKNVSPSISGFALNLFQYPWLRGNDPKFGIELIGADTFDANDSDWACGEIFEGNPRSLAIPIQFSSDDWEQCLERMIRLSSEYLASNSDGASRLNSVQGVGIGFVDGELHLLKA